MQAPPGQPSTPAILPKVHWSARLRSQSHRHEWEAISPYEFVCRHLPFSFAIMTVLPLAISVLDREWQELGVILGFSYCIGTWAFILLLLLRVYVLPAFTLPIVLLVLACLAIVPLALVFGVVTCGLLTDKDLGSSITAIVFTAIGTSFAAMQLVSVERHRRATSAERTAVAARLQVLQAQIEPHFLFNTLAGLNELIATDATRAQQMLAHLNHYLRASLAHARSDASTLANEFELLRAYLSIMEMRWPQRLRISVECAVDCGHLLFPPMLVQPLVENAVTHGIEPLREGGLVRVDARRECHNLVISVEDSGIGLGRSVRHGAGTGVRTVRDRLEALFGCCASLELTRRTPQGTRAEIKIPLNLLD
jgi:sensor histidine kinase YesM